MILADTAGLRDSDDPVEQEGLRRARRRAEEAEIRLFVFDARHPADAIGAAAWPGPDTIPVANKIDLLRKIPPASFSPSPASGGGKGGGDTVRWGSASGLESPASPQPSPPPRAERGEASAPDDVTKAAFPISALTGDGLDILLSVLGSRIAETYHNEAPLLTRARHRQALEDAAASLARALAADLPELRAEDLRLALRSLGHITGTVDVEDLLDIIFRDFCLGK